MRKPTPKKQANIPKWQICTEGKTEAIYLEGLIKELGLERFVRVNCDKGRVPERGCGKQHGALLDCMENCRKGLQVEKMWMVHDFDKAADEKGALASFIESFDRDRSPDAIKVMYAIPSFEYWLMLHEAYSDSDLHRHTVGNQVKACLNRHRREQKRELLHKEAYKTDPDIYHYFCTEEKRKKAIQHARKAFRRGMPQTGRECAKKKPSTNLFELIEELVKFSERIKKR